MWRRPAIALLLLLTAPLARGADAPFEKDIRAFEAADAKQPPSKDAILFVGSSSIRFWTTLKDDFPDLQVINRGFGGSEIADSTRYADRIVIPYHPRQIVMYAGDNDLAKGKSPRQVADDFKAFVQKVRSALPDVPISYICIKPSIQRWKLADKIREADHLIREYAAGEKNIDYIDVFTPMLDEQGMPRKELLREDGLHLNREGYKLWVSLVRPFLRQPPSSAH
jgi:lysophospholipase L1-like esterase